MPLTIVSAKRPVRPAPFALDELHTDPRHPNPPRPLAPATSWDGLFQRLDKALHVYHKVALPGLRRAAMRSAARWIVERQENDGCWGGIQPPPSTPSSPCTSAATTSTTPCCVPVWTPSTGSPSGARTVPG